MARHQRVHPRWRPRVPNLLHQQPRRRADGEHLELPRHHCARAPGGVGGLAEGLPTDPAVRVVDLARRVRGDGSGSARPGATPRRPVALVEAALIIYMTTIKHTLL